MKSFNELELSDQLTRAIQELGYETPSPIQQQALPILMGPATDFIGLAATGTGKTAAFGIPMLEKIDVTKKSVQVLILCPTRELAVQVSGQINLLGKYKNVKALPIYGGASYSDQIYGLKAGAMVVVGTPGRVIDHLERGTLKLENVTTVILDEADEMISMGFRDDLETILEKTSDSANTWLFSATMSPQVRKVADEYLEKPQQAQVNRTEVLSKNVEQIYYQTRESDKPEILCKLIECADEFYGIIFCQTKALVTDLNQYLSGKGYRVDCLHGDKDQKARERTMQAFRDKRVTILVCTDVAARGLDVKDVTHVVNYSIPRELDVYVHRIGRTARSGKAGVAVSFVTMSHRQLIGRIENMTKSRFKLGVVPTRKEIGEKKVALELNSFSAQKGYERAAALLGQDWKSLIEAMPKEEIVARFLAMKMPDVFVDRDRNETPNGPGLARATDSRQEGRSSERPSRRYDRPERSGGRFERPQREARSEYRPREDRGERTERPQRNERFERPERRDRPERSERSESPSFAARRPERDADSAGAPKRFHSGSRYAGAPKARR